MRKPYPRGFSSPGPEKREETFYKKREIEEYVLRTHVWNGDIDREYGEKAILEAEDYAEQNRGEIPKSRLDLLADNVEQLLEIE